MSPVRPVLCTDLETPEMYIRRGPPFSPILHTAVLRKNCTWGSRDSLPLSLCGGAAAAEVKRVLLRLLARPGVDHDLAYCYPAIVAGVRVVLVFSGWVRMGCARLLCGHEVPPRGPGPGVRQHLRGHFLIRRPNCTICVLIMYRVRGIISEKFIAYLLKVSELCIWIMWR